MSAFLFRRFSSPILPHAIPGLRAPGCGGTQGRGPVPQGGRRTPGSCLLEFLVVHGEFGHRPLDPAVLGLQLLQASGLVHLKTSVLGPPEVESLLRHPDEAGGFSHGTTRGNDHLRIPDLVDDLFDMSLPRYFVQDTIIDPGSVFGGRSDSPRLVLRRGVGIYWCGRSSQWLDSQRPCHDRLSEKRRPSSTC